MDLNYGDSMLMGVIFYRLLSVYMISMLVGISGMIRTYKGMWDIVKIEVISCGFLLFFSKNLNIS